MKEAWRISTSIKCWRHKTGILEHSPLCGIIYIGSPSLDVNSKQGRAMRPFFRSLRLLFPAILLTTCTPARTGVIGNTLTTNVKPRISITGQAPWTVAAHGRFSPYSGPTTTTEKAILEYNYVFYTDSRHSDRFAHAAIVKIEHGGKWNFQPPGRFDDAFLDGSELRDGIQWSVQTLRISNADDWPGSVWEDAGNPPHRIWLAKRWIAHLDSTTRAIMEYREAWPENMPVLSSTMPILSDSAGTALRAFDERADAVFLAEKKAGDFSGQPAPDRRQATFRIQPDIPKLLGNVIALHGS